MADSRYLFGSGAGDFAIAPPSRHGGFLVAATSVSNGTFWSDRTGGTQYTDLQTVDGGVASTVSTDKDGSVIPFYGPAGVFGGWLDFGQGGRVYVVGANSIDTAVANALSKSQQIADSAASSAASAAASAASAASSSAPEIAYATDGAPYTGSNPSDSTKRLVTEATASTTYATKAEAAAGAVTPATLAVQRLDRQNVSAQRTGGGKASIAYSDALEFTEQWNDLTAWSSSNVQVSGNRLYFNTGAQGSAIHAFPVAANENAHITGLLYWKAGGTGAVYFGIDVGTAGHAPVANSPEGLFLGLNGSNQRAVFNGSTAGTTATGLNLIGSNPTVDTTYSWTIDIGDNYVSFAMHALGSSTDSATAYVSRAGLTAAGKSINNIALYLGDTRALTGHSFSPVVAVKSRQQTRTKTLASVVVEGVEHRQIVTANPAGLDPWRFSIPASYDARTPSPVVIYCHQSITGNQHSPWSESRAQPVVKALLDAGYIVAAANDAGDRWGNQASLDNYLALYKHLRDSFNTGALFMLGVSMGSLPILNGIVRGVSPTPNAVATIGGVVNLDDLWANNTGSYAAGIRSSYGIAADGSDYATKTSGWNPATRTGAEFRGVPFRLYTSTGDTAVPKATNQDALSAKLANYSPEATVVLGSGGHLDPSQFQASDVVAFFNTYR